ncbi:hypothetical protein COJE103337_01095 [Corynebacterium jeikeium]|uniref:hypothetical protein n=1 Tax=Corynebacterium jeikeium TaxID=38289 RepID=UPI0001B7167E|nr:hypothetical protein [Corynebacterium jeikeium]EEW16751.1 Tat pathway signal sequence domain protein [Corynebacterium jeikeium ATCC 43734]OOD33477.1 hypothetical protein BWP03_02740 [Corynebacterium jeikeium]WCZ52812.1 hypothetical protein CJEIK_01335 [Corynebacterium jeikeium]SUY81882.1 hypothetical membrane protein [Corynebacterium jeikeium]
MAMPPVTAFEADRWMDSEEHPTGRGSSFKGISFKGVMNPALEAPRRFFKFASTSPGLLTIVSTILVLAILAAGGAMVYSSQNRQAQLNTLVSRTEPLSDAAQELFNSLSVADSVATTSFLRKSTTNAATRDYDAAMSSASMAIIRATSGIDDIESREMELVLQIQNSMPDYLKLMSNAQTHDRLRNPVGASYLAQASTLMQDTMLPAAQELYSRTSEEVSTQQAKLSSPLWFPLSGIVAAIIMLVIAQFWLAALTNRRLNLGYVGATGLMLFALVWASLSAALTWHAGNQNVQGTVRPLEQLTAVRISVQQSRTQEALGLIQRDYGEDRQQEFSDSMADIDSKLEGLRNQVSHPERIDTAREALRSWDESHAKMVSELKNGRYTEALAAALDTKVPEENKDGKDKTDSDGRDGKDDPLTTGEDTSDFTVVDNEMQELISSTRAELRDILVEGRTAAGHVTNLVLALTVLSALCVFFGTRPRLQEFL